jgi:glutamine amidotransferase/cyclase
MQRCRSFNSQCSCRNAISAVGFRVKDICSPEELAEASVVVFPGVGAFGCAMDFLEHKGYKKALKEYITSGKPFMGICLGMQTLFEGSDEAEGVEGLGIIPGKVCRFPHSDDYSVPHIGWNGVSIHNTNVPAVQSLTPSDSVYFVHSYRAMPSEANADWVALTTDYGGQKFISAVAKGNVFATQFHPEKSGAVGLRIFQSFLTNAVNVAAGVAKGAAPSAATYASVLAAPPTRLCRRIVA